MLVKRTSKNQLTLPKAFLKAAGIGDRDDYFDAEYDKRRHVIFLRPVKIIVEEKLSPEVIERFEAKALRMEKGDKMFNTAKEAEQFFESRMKKR